MFEILNMIMIHICIVYAIDVAEFVDGLKRIVGLGGRTVKPFDCSICMTFWCTLLYGVFVAGFHPILSIFLSMCFSSLANFTGGIMIGLQTYLETVTDRFNHRIENSGR